MDNTEKIERKRLKIEESLNLWAEENNILNPSERIIVNFRIKRMPNLSAEMKVVLPDDYEGSYGHRKTWHLSDREWDAIEESFMDENYKAFVKLLHSRQNGPLHVSEIVANGIDWELKRFVLNFNRTLKTVALKVVGGNKVSYRLEQPKQRTNYYAIIKSWFV